MKHDRCASFGPVSKLNQAGNGAERSAESEKQMWSVVWLAQCRSQALGLEATVCDFASAGTVPLAHLAEAAMSQSVAEVRIK